MPVISVFLMSNTGIMWSLSRVIKAYEVWRVILCRWCSLLLSWWEELRVLCLEKGHAYRLYAPIKPLKAICLFFVGLSLRYSWKPQLSSSHFCSLLLSCTPAVSCYPQAPPQVPLSHPNANPWSRKWPAHAFFPQRCCFFSWTIYSSGSISFHYKSFSLYQKNKGSLMLQMAVQHSLLIDQLLDDGLSLVQLVTHYFLDVFVLFSKDAEGYRLIFYLLAGDLPLMLDILVF